MIEQSERHIRVLTQQAKALSRMAEHAPAGKQASANADAYDAWKEVHITWVTQGAILDIEPDIDEQ